MDVVNNKLQNSTKVAANLLKYNMVGDIRIGVYTAYDTTAGDIEGV